MKKMIGSLLLTSLMAGITGCNSQQSSEQITDSSAQKLSGEEITFGAVLPFSGGLETFGEQAKAGINLAVKEINAAGGIEGKPLNVIYEDNKTDPKTSVEKATRLIRQEEAIALIGPISSSARDAMTPTVTKLKTPLLYATNYEGGVCQDYVYSFNTVPNQELENLIPEIAASVGKSFYLYGTDYIWPQKMFESAEQEIAKVSGTIAGKEFTPWGVKDYTPAIRKIMDSDADVLVLAVPGVDGTTFIKQAQKLGLTKEISIAFLGFSETYIPALGDTTDIDMWTAVPFISTMESSNTFVADVQANSDTISGVSHYARTHYDAVKAMASALEKTKDYTAEGVLTGLKNLKTDSVDINADNQANLNMYIGKLENNELTMVKDLGTQAAHVGCVK